MSETNRRKVAARLARDGWSLVHGGEHNKYTHPDHRDVLIVLPCHRELSKGVARSIARQAGWAN